MVYGQTEASPVVTQTWREDALDDLSGTTGQPLPHTEFAIFDPDTNAVKPLNPVGEICARGYSVMQAYNVNLEATADAELARVLELPLSTILPAPAGPVTPPGCSPRYWTNFPGAK